ncbi:MAG: hypothetical protein N838_26795 [Thiohalocapsa sp. PB-PSB1]|nr:MAG: hypothetical protein N838_26795 [Thiohalocapsa sp. PB-PSB1]
MLDEVAAFSTRLSMQQHLMLYPIDLLHCRFVH